MKRVFWLRKTHKWLALLVGLQILIWSLSGLYMTFVDIDIIHGDHLVNQQDAQIVSSQNILPISKKIIKEFTPFQSIRLKKYFEQSVYEIRTKNKRIIIDAFTGRIKKTLPKPVIEQQAIAIYAGNAEISQIELLNNYPAEIGGRKQPVWQVSYNDRLHSTLYFHHQSGRLISKRGGLWRTFDFLWVLHIMEYGGSSGYVGWLFRIFSLTSLLMALLGSWLLFYRLEDSRR